VQIGDEGGELVGGHGYLRGEKREDVSNAKTQKRKDRKGTSKVSVGSSLRSLHLCIFAPLRWKLTATVHNIEQCNQL